MEHYSRLSPQECLDRAEAFVVEQDGWVRERTDTSATFQRYVMPSCGEWVAILVVSLLTFGLGLLYGVARIALVIAYPAQAGIRARRTDDGRTRILVDGRHAEYRDEIDQWARSNLAVS